MVKEEKHRFHAKILNKEYLLKWYNRSSW